MDFAQWPPAQNRAAFRTPLQPGELVVENFWVHDPGVVFVDSPLGPEQHIVLLNEGIRVVNLSAGGALVALAAPPSLALLRIISQTPEPETVPPRATILPFKDVSITSRLELRNDTRHLFITGNIVRATLVRANTDSTDYELALKFYSWGDLSGPVIQRYKVRDDSGIPPISSWITQRQLRPR